jgi:hypothetical protein
VGAGFERPIAHSQHSIIDQYYVELAYPFQVAASKLRNSLDSIARRTTRPTPMRDHVASMTGEPPSEVLGSLPRTRPHRRSQKRPPRAARAADTRAATVGTRTIDAPADGQAKAKPAMTETAKAKPANAKTAAPRRVTPRPAPSRLRQPAQPAGTPPGPRNRRPAPSNGSDVLGTAVQAAAELAEIGLSVGARAIRGAVARLPRP